MGTPDFAVLPLQKMMEAGYEVVGVVTNPDKPAGRGQKLQESAVKRFAVERGLKVLQPEKFREEDFLRELAGLQADLQLVVAFKMLPEVVWSMPRLGTVNLHASLLPDYRGAAPINRAVMNGEKVSGVSTFLLKHEIDTGNVIFQERVEIGEDMTAGELHDRLMETGADLLVRTVDAIEAGDYVLTEQETLLEGREPVHAPKIFKEDMQIDWTKDVDTVYNHIRGLSPFPTAWTVLKNGETGETTPLKVYRTRKVTGQGTAEPGTIVSDGRKTLGVCVKGGVIELEELQLAGKKWMTVAEFLCGFNPDGFSMV